MVAEQESLFLIQAEKVVKEVIEQISGNKVDRIAVERFDEARLGLEPAAENGLNIQTAGFYSVVARQTLTDQLADSPYEKSISKCFFENGQMLFFVIFYEKYSERMYQKYHLIADRIISFLFDFLIEKWNENALYFYNGSVSNFIMQKAVDSVVTEISTHCGHSSELSLYENLNLSLPQIITALSYQTYEKSITEGLIYFTDDIESADFQFEFSAAEEIGNFDMKNLKLIRKLLELSSHKNGIGIISDTNRIYGIGSVSGEQIYYKVQFNDDHKWTVFRRDEELLTIKDNCPVFAGGSISRREFVNYAEKVFPEKKGSEDIGAMYDIIRSLSRQGKGTILVVMKDAAEKIHKYGDLCMEVKAVRLDEKNVEKLSSIDGAIFMDPDCICYGFGVVLDGLDTGTGNRARGSRYNSSERFYNLYKNEEETGLMLFILSDDGNFNLFPKLEK